MAFRMWKSYILLIFLIGSGITAREYNFFRSNTSLSHLSVDTKNSTLYVGAINMLYQLTADLQLVQEAEIGPKMDNKMCIPPFTDLHCPKLVLTDNYIKLLALDTPKDRIVVCGSHFMGICALRRMQNISEEILYDITKGEKSFVATNQEHISTVGLISGVLNMRLLFVGNSKEHFVMTDLSKSISTRLLDEFQDRDPFETVSDNSYIRYDFMSDMHLRFIKVFQTHKHVYFILTRQDKLSGEKKTFISRQCKEDFDYYSYIEIVLECKSDKKGNTVSFNVVQSVYVTEPGEDLAQSMTYAGAYGNVTSRDILLFVVFHKVARSYSPEQSAVCIFPLKKIDEKIEEIRTRAYNRDTREGDKSVISQFYGFDMWSRQQDGKRAASLFPCGEEHLPHPLRSTLGLTVEPVMQYSKRLTAVAIAVEERHTLAFLGTADGEIHKVSLPGIAMAEQYKTINLGNNGPVKSELVFDAQEEHLYVMTDTKITRLPVQECEEFMDCQSCTASRDPYCGWCVSEEKCTRNSTCARGKEEDHWLVWSSPNPCVENVHADPTNWSSPSNDQQESQQVEQAGNWTKQADAN